MNDTVTGGRTLSLRVRLLAILLMALLALQLLSFGAIGWYRGHLQRQVADAPVVADVLRVRGQLLAEAPATRAALAQQLDRAAYRWIVLPRSTATTDDRRSRLQELANRVAAASGAAVAATRWQGAEALRLALDASDDLLAVFADDLATTTPPPWAALVYLPVISAAVAAVAWLAVSIATRPLSRAAEAARAMAADVGGAPIDEHGPPEVRELAQSLNALQREVSRQLESRTRILSAVTHDLKTPITRMQLRLASLPDGEARRRLEADLDAMATLVAEGLEYARSEQLREQRHPVDVDALLENLAEQAQDLGQQCRYVAPARPLPPVHAAPQALARLLQNLLDNAIRYGGSAQIDARAVGDALEIRVADRGPGVDADELESLFEPFVRGESSRGRGTGGSGLGLAIARNIAHAHKGRVWLAPREGGGLVATVQLPLTPPGSSPPG